MLVKEKGLSASEEQVLEGDLGSVEDPDFEDDKTTPAGYLCPVRPSLLLPLSLHSHSDV